MPNTIDSVRAHKLLLLNAEQRIAVYGVNATKFKGKITIHTKTTVNNDGYFIGILSAVLLLTYVMYTQRKRLRIIVNAIIAERYFNQFVREDNALVQRVFLILTLIFALILPLFICQVINYYHFNTNDIKGFALYIVLLLLLAIVYFVKIITASFLGYVFMMEGVVKSHFYNVFLTNNLLGMFLLPIVTLITYGNGISIPFFIKMGLAIIVLGYAFRTLRSLFMNIGFKGGAVYHLFLYFCTLEILPLVVLFKLLSSII